MGCTHRIHSAAAQVAPVQRESEAQLDVGPPPRVPFSQPSRSYRLPFLTMPAQRPVMAQAAARAGTAASIRTTATAPDFERRSRAVVIMPAICRVCRLAAAQTALSGKIWHAEARPDTQKQGRQLELVYRWRILLTGSHKDEPDCDPPGRKMCPVSPGCTGGQGTQTRCRSVHVKAWRIRDEALRRDCT